MLEFFAIYVITSVIVLFIVAEWVGEINRFGKICAVLFLLPWIVLGLPCLLLVFLLDGIFGFLFLKKDPQK